MVLVFVRPFVEFYDRINNSIKIFSLLQDGMQNLQTDEHLNKKDYGNIISGISAVEDKVYFSTSEGIVSSYSEKGDEVTSVLGKPNLDLAYLGQMKLSFDGKKLVQRAINSGKGSKILEIDLETSTLQTHEIHITAGSGACRRMDSK